MFLPFGKFNFFCFHLIFATKMHYTEVHFKEIHLSFTAVIAVLTLSETEVFSSYGTASELWQIQSSVLIVQASTSVVLISSLKRLSVNSASLKDPNQHILDSGAIKLDLWIAIISIGSLIVDKAGCAPPQPSSSVRLTQRRREKQCCENHWKNNKRQIKRASRAFRGQTSITPTKLHPLCLSALLSAAMRADVSENDCSTGRVCCTKCRVINQQRGALANNMMDIRMQFTATVIYVNEDWLRSRTARSRWFSDQFILCYTALCYMAIRAALGF